MPLLIYGAELSDEDMEITIDNFSSLIDPQSWEEFMPKGVTKQKFNNFKNTMIRKYSVPLENESARWPVLRTN